MESEDRQYARDDYDTREGIERLLRDGLAGLNKLHALRVEAGYGRGERMQDWCILGRWVTDSCGNFGRILDGAPAGAYRRVPPAMTMEEAMAKYCRRIEWGMRSHIPPAHVRCVDCQKPFTVKDAHSTQETKRDLDEPIPQCAGRTLAEVEGEWQWCSALQTRRIAGLSNPAWVDLRPYKELHPDAGDWAKDQVVNPDGWRERGEVKKGEPIPPGSTASFAVFEWHHAACLGRREREQERAFFDGVLHAAGFDNCELREIPNEYWPGGMRGETPAPPWFEVDVPDFGRLKIGWRKRVISIDWSCFRDAGDALDGERLFAGEGVTVGRALVHAWGEEKCVEYLKRLREAAGA